ncbi:Predicted ATPase [Thermomonospora echinospora]|uniref:Predicted ATPase n=1 Tax=Thermomonospora echinospora TaxID=1992 RepID=A0A1H6DYZ9_9ACTN|nr:BTAD domain-containing putative transcriptional regulator [Thermomonospora echinospora]SEG89996.1 Predicted ATPase [Thermomonospora echinospora]
MNGSPMVQPAVHGGAGIPLGGWHIDVLGPLEVRRAGQVVELPPRRRSLLAVLALRAGTMVTVDGLVDALWGEDPPPTAVRTLHAHIAKLAALLPGNGDERLIRRRDPGYLLDAETARVDRVRFEELITGGLRHVADGRFAESARMLSRALALWRGEALADCPVHGWALTEVDHLHEMRLQAHEGLLASRLVLGGLPESGTGEIERLVAQHPFRERLWELLIVALHLGGRTGDALNAYHRVRRGLVEELGLDPGEGLRQVEAGVLRGVTDPRELLRLPTGRTPAGTGPLTVPQQVTTLIGREAEITGIRELLRAARLVTLTGLGGIGKTSLAVAASRAAADDFADIAFVDLAPSDDEASIVAAIAEALGVHPRGGRLLDEIARRISCDRVLLVVDNCEHLVEACAPIVRELLGRCPHLRVLATSQQALRVPGEALKPVPELRVPPPALVRSGTDLVGHDAAVLFADRAGIGKLETLSTRDARAVATICARCHGLPLAIELAAARARMFTLPEMAHRLQDPFAVLTEGPRGARPQHRALRATVEWSYRLLTAEERRALRRFSVFNGAFTLEAAGAVHPETAPLEMLGRLVDKSLVKVVRTAAGTRYQLVATIRAFALDRSRAHPDEHARTRQDHARHHRRQAEEIERRLQGPQLDSQVVQIAERHEDVRAALTWLTENDPEGALRLAASLWRYHYLRGGYAEGRAWLSSALAARTPEVPSGTQAKALWALAKLAALECDYREADEHARRALELYTRDGDVTGVARSRALLGAIARELGHYDRALEYAHQSLAAAERGGDRWATGHALQLLGFVSWLSGDWDSAGRYSEQAMHCFRPIGDHERLAWCQIDLGAAAYYAGDLDTAARHLHRSLLMSFGIRFREGIAWAENLLALIDLRQGRRRQALRRLVTSLELHHELGDRWRLASVLDALAGALAGHDAPLAAELLGTAGWLRDGMGALVPACERAELAATRARIVDRIGAEAVERASALGRWQDVTALAERVRLGSAAR